MEHRGTVPAILVNAILVVPCLSLGEVAGRAVDGAFRSNVSDRFVGWLASGSALGTLAILALALVIGLMAGLLSMGITSRLFRSANYQIVAYSVSCIYATMYGLFALFIILAATADLALLSALVSVAGLIAGLFAMNGRIPPARTAPLHSTP